MGVLPENRTDLIIFCEAHVPVWAANAAAIGLTAAQVTALQNFTTVARTKFNGAQAARQASLAATDDFYNSVRSMRGQAADLVRLIKAKAEADNNPNVYVLAQIPPPSAPTALPAPGKPTDIQITLNPGGSITLSWESTNSAPSSGAFFLVSRRITSGPAATPAFVGIGGTAIREFTDDTITAGTAGLSYIIQGFRGTRAGTPSDQIAVQFGIGGTGGGGGDGIIVSGGNLRGNVGAAGSTGKGVGLAA